MTGQRHDTSGGVSPTATPSVRISSTTAASARLVWIGPLVALVGTLAGLMLSAWMAKLSDGVHHDDDLTHLQMARWASTYPEYLLHEWGRPGFTALFAIPAQFGWFAARVFSGLLTAATAWLTYLIARRQGLTLAPLAPWLVWLQPMVFTLSYTTLTETVLAFYLALAMGLFLRRWFTASAAVLSLCLLTRHEAAIWLPLWALALWRGGSSWRAYAALLWAPIVHNVLCGLFLGRWPFLLFLVAKPTEEYGAGGWFAMLSRWALAAGAGLLVLALAGGWRAARRPWGWLWIGAGLSYFLAHTLFFRFGLFASGGYERFLVPLGPVVAVAAVETLGWFFAAVRQVVARVDTAATVREVRLAIAAITVAVGLLWIGCEIELPVWLDWARRWLRLGGVLLMIVIALAWLLCGVHGRRVRFVAMAACPAMCLWFAGHQVQIAAGVQAPFQVCAPLVLVEDQLLIREAAEWARANGLAGRPVIGGNPWVDEFFGQAVSPHRYQFHESLSHARPGDLFVWERRYVGRPGQVSVDQMRAIPGMIELWHGREHSRDGIYCRVFEFRGAPASAATRGASASARPGTIENP